MFRSILTPAVLRQGILLCVFAACAAGVGCRPLQPKAQKQPFWHKFLPPEDFFWDDRSREIEQNLQRENRVSIQ